MIWKTAEFDPSEQIEFKLQEVTRLKYAEYLFVFIVTWISTITDVNLRSDKNLSKSWYVFKKWMQKPWNSQQYVRYLMCHELQCDM